MNKRKGTGSPNKRKGKGTSKKRKKSSSTNLNFIVPQTPEPYEGMESLFSVFNNPKEKGLCFVTSEVFGSALGISGYRSSMKKVHPNHKFNVSFGGNLRQCVTERGLVEFLVNCRAKNRASLCKYISAQYGVEMPAFLTEESSKNGKDNSNRVSYEYIHNFVREVDRINDIRYAAVNDQIEFLHNEIKQLKEMIEHRIGSIE